MDSAVPGADHNDGEVIVDDAMDTDHADHADTDGEADGDDHAIPAEDEQLMATRAKYNYELVFDCHVTDGFDKEKHDDEDNVNASGNGHGDDEGMNGPADEESG